MTLTFTLLIGQSYLKTTEQRNTFLDAPTTFNSCCFHPSLLVVATTGIFFTVNFLRNQWLFKRSTAGTAVTFSIHYPKYQNVRQNWAGKGGKRRSNHHSSTTETVTKVIGEEYWQEMQGNSKTRNSQTQGWRTPQEWWWRSWSLWAENGPHESMP